MREELFKNFLETEGITSKGIAFRMTKAKKVESYLGKNLDAVVSSEAAMLQALLALKIVDNIHSPMQNALRKYYKFVNGSDFPQLRAFGS